MECLQTTETGLFNYLNHSCLIIHILHSYTACFCLQIEKKNRFNDLFSENIFVDLKAVKTRITYIG